MRIPFILEELLISWYTAGKQSLHIAPAYFYSCWSEKNFEKMIDFSFELQTTHSLFDQVFGYYLGGSGNK